MYFDAAEQKLQDLDAAVTALQETQPIDLSGIQGDVAALQDVATELQAAVAALDARLDAMSLAAQG